MSIKACPHPPQSLLADYQRAGAYTDCFVTTIERPVGLDEYVTAFYTTWLFKLERWILARVVAKPSTDEDARRVATGESSDFAAWTVESREPDQMLLCDFQGNTRSWFLCRPEIADGSTATALYFGSAVTALGKNETDARKARRFQIALPFHKLYSRALLACALRRLGKQGIPVQRVP